MHGHWTIDVKDPDGKVVTHREFENALSQGFPYLNYGTLPSGSSLLSALITGQTMMTPVAWAIVLEGPGYPSGTNSPCVYIPPGYGGPTSACILTQNAPSSFLVVQGGCPSAPLPIYSCNLAVSPLGTAPNFTGFQLSGSIVSTQAGTVSAVATVDANACGPTDSLASCTFVNSNGLVSFTSKNLDGNTVPGDPMPVTVSAAGQTIQVTVNISFQ